MPQNQRTSRVTPLVLKLRQKADMEREFTAVIQKRGRWYVAFVEEAPGMNTQGRTLTEVRRNLKEALRLIIRMIHRLGAGPAGAESHCLSP